MPNRLLREKSPYLLQHAHNPVDWFPWGEEAFMRAKREDKPIFLSIGYATCHWCHVMEEESFENEEIAFLLNQVFIPIKVDREELPAVDSLYMDYAYLLKGQGLGWPLNVVLTPDLKPFFAVTYLPPTSHRGMLGLKEFTLRIQELWNSLERKVLLQQAEKVASALFDEQKTPLGLPREKDLVDAIEELLKRVDPLHGGSLGSLKFPMGYRQTFLLHYAHLKKDPRVLEHVECTLDKMYRGGIYDHLGGGFSRYAVDEKWEIPHFEKMLYDNVFLAEAYLEAWRVTKKEIYRQVAEETLAYLCRDLLSFQGKEGGYSGEDADSEGEEGLFYTWTKQEIESLFSPEESALFSAYYGITDKGNFEGRNVLHLPLPLEEFCREKQLDLVEGKKVLEDLRQKLFQIRQKRPRPLKDDKVLTAWNGLLIHLLAQAGWFLEKKELLTLAQNLAYFLQKELVKEGLLLRRWREKEAAFEGVLEDYAFLIMGLLSLFRAGCGSDWLKWAITLTQEVDALFSSSEEGGFYQTKIGQQSLLKRKKVFYDGAEPSGNAIHAENLLRLYQITGKLHYLQKAEGIFQESRVKDPTHVEGMCYHLKALQRYLDQDTPTLLIALGKKGVSQAEIASLLAGVFSPHLEVIWKREDDTLLTNLLSSLHDKCPIGQHTTIYLCRKSQCSLPIWKKEELLTAIQNL